MPILTGISRTLSASSTVPFIITLPPVMTTPAGTNSLYPDFRISAFASANISSILGSITIARSRLETFLKCLPPTLGTSISSSGDTSSASAVPCFSLIFLASASGVDNPSAMSRSMLSPPSVTFSVYLMLPPTNTAISVVPPPQSIKTTPISFSSSVSTASLDASCSSTTSATSIPAP